VQENHTWPLAQGSIIAQGLGSPEAKLRSFLKNGQNVSNP
jgi:hypothetical protein